MAGFPDVGRRGRLNLGPRTIPIDEDRYHCHLVVAVRSVKSLALGFVRNYHRDHYSVGLKSGRPLSAVKIDSVTTPFSSTSVTSIVISTVLIRWRPAGSIAVKQGNLVGDGHGSLSTGASAS